MTSDFYEASQEYQDMVYEFIDSFFGSGDDEEEIVPQWYSGPER